MLVGKDIVVLGVAWWIVIEVIRSRSQSNSKGLWWLHVTAPLVTILCTGVGIWLWVSD